MINALITQKQFMDMTDGGLFARRHQIIRQIDDLLGKYPSLPLAAQILACCQLMKYCDEYLEMLKRERRSSKRTGGVFRLRQSASDQYERLKKMRAQQNFRSLMKNPRFNVLKGLQDTGGSSNAKRLEDHETLEALDHLHRAGHELSKIHDGWMKDQTTKKNFWQYLDEYVAANPQNDLYQVRYLSEHERLSYRVRVCGGQLMQGDSVQSQPFDTQSMAVNKDNPANQWGRAIFVVSISDEIYSGGSFSNPVLTENGGATRESGDVFHHSSFLMGKPVRCAGEWIVNNGKIKLISPASGHYRPPADIFIMFLRNLRNQGVRLEEIVVEWFVSGSGYWYYNAADIANLTDISSVTVKYRIMINNWDLRTLEDPNNASSFRDNGNPSAGGAGNDEYGKSAIKDPLDYNKTPNISPAQSSRNPVAQPFQPPVTQPANAFPKRWATVQPADRLGKRRNG